MKHSILALKLVFRLRLRSDESPGINLSQRDVLLSDKNKSLYVCVRVFARDRSHSLQYVWM